MASTPQERFNQALQALSVGAPGTIKEALDTVLSNEEPGLGEGDSTEVIETGEGDDDDDPVVEQPVEVKVAAGKLNIFQHPDAHPIVLDLVLLREYGPEWFTWEAETLQWQIPQDFPTQSVSDLNMHKLQAIKTLHLSDRPWTDWEVFTWCCMPLTGILPDFDVMQAPTAAQSMVAVDIFNKIRQDVPWTDEIKSFLGSAWRLDGVLCPIAPLEFITMDTVGLPFDCTIINQQWPLVRTSRKVPMGNTVEDEQLRRLLVLDEFLQRDRAKFLQQSEEVLR